MQWLIRRIPRAGALLLLFFLFLAGLAAAPASAMPRPQEAATASVSVVGTITALNAGAGTLQVTDRAGFSAILKTSGTTLITLDGTTATLAKLAVNDPVRVTFDRTTRVASRV